jgi:hypothetical protein
MNADGSNETNLSNDPGSWDIDPAWSPNGAMITFSTDRLGREYRDFEVFVMNADGSDPRDLTNEHVADDRWPDYSPDGQSIAFATFRAVAPQPHPPPPPLPPPPPQPPLPPPPTPRCLVPRVIGMRLANARTKIRRRGCRVGRVRRAGAKRSWRGRVVAQKPRAGLGRARGAKVTIVIGRKRRG